MNQNVTRKIEIRLIQGQSRNKKDTFHHRGTSDNEAMCDVPAEVVSSLANRFFQIMSSIGERT